MNEHLCRAAAAVGLAAIGWVGAGYLQTNPLALAMTALVAAFYLAGALELHRFQRDTRGLARALAADAAPPPTLQEWLAEVPAGLRHAVRLRVEGERVGLPGPTMTPYLTGLLVLLGMLGTFLGMVVTLAGTGVALERATDLPSMRDSLAAPIKGLGLAFGTSVAGVAASAMLGLMSALCRRDRLRVAQRLDAHAANTLGAYTRARQREESLALQRQQALQLPALVDRLEAMLEGWQAQARATDEHLRAGQDRFHGQAEAAYRELAVSVDRSLRQSLGDSARVVAATIEPAVQAAMGGIARETTALHGQVAASVQQQLDGLSRRFEATTQTVADTWTRALALHERSAEAQAQRLQSDLAARDAQRLAAWTASLSAVAASLQQVWQQAGTRSAEQQAQICATLEHTAGRIAAQAEAHARGTIAEIARLVQTAAEAPRAAAEVVSELRERLSDSIARDNAMLEERGRLLAALHTLLDAVQHAGSEQKAAIDSLVAAAAARLEQAGQRFTEQVDRESARMEATAAQLGGSAVDVASLGEAFGHAVALFGQASDKLMGHLQRVEAALGKSITRSDEQLAYYVAQAREVIDLSLMSQKQIVDDLQRLAGQRAAEASAA